METIKEQNAHSLHEETKVDSTHHAHHIVSPMVYIVILVVLLILTALTVYVSQINFNKYAFTGGYGNLVIALGVAVVKSTLVLLYFMHVKYSGRLVHLTIGVSLLFFVLLIFGVLMDVWTRQNVLTAPIAPLLR